MAIFEKAYDPVRQWEGGWCHVEGDRGGETYAGIARNFWPGWPGWKTIDGAKQHTSFRSGARAFSRHLDGIPGLRDMVEDWYRTEWWDRMSLGTLPQTLADELFEQAVNLGRGGAVRSLQRPQLRQVRQASPLSGFGRRRSPRRQNPFRHGRYSQETQQS